MPTLFFSLLLLRTCLANPSSIPSFPTTTACLQHDTVKLNIQPQTANFPGSSASKNTSNITSKSAGNTTTTTITNTNTNIALHLPLPPDIQITELLGESATICIQIKARIDCVTNVAKAFNAERIAWLNKTKEKRRVKATADAPYYRIRTRTSSQCMTSTENAIKEFEHILQENNKETYSTLLEPIFANKIDLFDTKFWIDLCPNFHITTSNKTIATKLPHQSLNLHRYRRLLKKNGYFQEDNIDWDNKNTETTTTTGPLATMTQLATCVRSLTDFGFPATFAFVFDEFWHIANLLRDNIVSKILGETALLSSEPYAWRLSKSRPKQIGFQQHRDWAGTNSTSLNVWVALTESTPKNGCLYCIPRPFDTCQGDEDLVTPNYCQNNKTNGFCLANIRALPVKEGGILAWHGDFLHWSGTPEWVKEEEEEEEEEEKCDETKMKEKDQQDDDRIAIAFDFLQESKADLHPLGSVALVENPLTLNLRIRLFLVARSMWRFATNRQPTLKIVEAFVFLVVRSGY